MLRPSLILAALLIAAPAAAQQAGGFQLPSNPAPTASPRAQGPVDEESGPLIQRPRVIVTATPTPSPTAVATPVPTAAPNLPPAARPTNVAPTARSTPAPSRTAPAAPAAGPAISSGEAGDGGLFTAPTLAATPSAMATPPVLTAPTASRSTDAVVDSSPVDWLRIALGAILVAALAGLAFWWRRREARPLVPQTIERPVVDSPAAAPLAMSPATLHVAAEPLRLTRSFAFATLDYRLTLANRGEAALSHLAVGADVVSAHAGAPVETQLATPATVIEVRHEVERIGPHQTLRLEGQVRLPLADVQVIRQGRTPLLVPLLRVRVERIGSAEAPLTKTFVIGQGLPGGGRVQPFNLDEGPRAYTEVAQRELA